MPPLVPRWSIVPYEPWIIYNCTVLDWSKLYVLIIVVRNNIRINHVRVRINNAVLVTWIRWPLRNWKYTILFTCTRSPPAGASLNFYTAPRSDSTEWRTIILRPVNENYFLFFSLRFPFCAIAPERRTPSSTTLVKSVIAFRALRALRYSSSASFLMLVFARPISFLDDNVHVPSRMCRGRLSTATNARFLSWSSLEIHEHA